MKNARTFLPLLLLLAGCTRTVPADVRSFVARVHRTKLDPERHDPRAMELYEEAEALRDRYAKVCQWPSLEAARRELAEYLNDHPPELARWQDRIVGMTREMSRELNQWNFPAAVRRLEEFARRFDEEHDRELAGRLEQLRWHIGQWAELWARRQCGVAWSERSLGRNDEARQILLSAYRELEGFADARTEIQAALKDIGD